MKAKLRDHVELAPPSTARLISPEYPARTAVRFVRDLLDLPSATPLTEPVRVEKLGLWTFSSARDMRRAVEKDPAWTPFSVEGVEEALRSRSLSRLERRTRREAAEDVRGKVPSPAKAYTLRRYQALAHRPTEPGLTMVRSTQAGRVTFGIWTDALSRRRAYYRQHELHEAEIEGARSQARFAELESRRPWYPYRPTVVVALLEGQEDRRPARVEQRAMVEDLAKEIARQDERGAMRRGATR